MKFLVTGGAGFIGSAVVRNLVNNRKYKVVNVDCLTYAGNLSSLASVAGSALYTFCKLNVLDRPQLQRVFAEHQPDVVLHLAAESHVDRSIDGPDRFLQTNVMGTFTLLQVAREYWQSMPEERRPDFRFHHVSTDEVFGDLSKDAPPFSETTSYAPSSPYSASKAASDHLVSAWHKTYGLPIVITNCSNNYGPYHFPEKLIPHIILNALHGKPLPVYGNGEQIRDWLYVEDHAEALCCVAESGRLGEVYNIGGWNERKNIDVVKAICRLLGELAPARHGGGVNCYEDLISFVPDRPGHDRRYAIDARKIHDHLGWKPSETFESGLRKTVIWYLENEEWWRPILKGDYQLKRVGQGK